jgi:transcriptional regulator with XRE-family HTH domain
MSMLGKFIRQQRIKRKLTQEQLASELDISRPTYVQIERGERELTVSEARNLAAIFDMSFENFVSEREPKRNVTLEKKRAKKSDEMHIRVTEKNLDKFKQVLLYVLNKVGSKPNIGETVLHKLLYFI